MRSFLIVQVSIHVHVLNIIFKTFAWIPWCSIIVYEPDKTIYISLPLCLNSRSLALSLSLSLSLSVCVCLWMRARAKELRYWACNRFGMGGLSYYLSLVFPFSSFPLPFHLSPKETDGNIKCWLAQNVNSVNQLTNGIFRFHVSL